MCAKLLWVFGIVPLHMVEIKQDVTTCEWVWGLLGYRLVDA
jgi:hypothetical protein